MSRIGKQPIIIPEGVEVKIEDQQVKVKGPEGELRQDFLSDVKIATEKNDDGKNQVRISLAKKTKKSAALWGLYRSLVFNMILGVTEGIEKKLEIKGIGYRAEAQTDKLTLHIGYSHPVIIEAPEGIQFSVDKNTITVSGIDKQAVGQIAAKIRDQRKPEPYKGKGIRYLGEEVRMKAGKKSAASE